MATTKGEPSCSPRLEVSTTREQSTAQRAEPQDTPQTTETAGAKGGPIPDGCSLYLCPNDPG